MISHLPRRDALFYLGCFLYSVLGFSSSSPQTRFQPWTLTQHNPLTPTWVRHMPGAVLTLSASNSGDILIVTHPDPDIPSFIHQPLLTRLDAHGKTLWQKSMDPIKDLTLSEDGRLAVVATHNDELLALNAQGKILWTHPGTCRPILLNATHDTLCFHDEDVDAHIAFDLINVKGKKIASYPIQGDALSFSLSANQKFFAISLTRGRALVWASTGQLWAKIQVPGEIVDLGISSQSIPRVAVLFRPTSQPEKTSPAFQSRTEQDVQVFEKEKSIFQDRMALEASQIEISETGDRLFFYAHGKKEQLLGSSPIEFSSASKQSIQPWLRGVNQPSVYPHPFILKQNVIFFGVEGLEAKNSTESQNQLFLLNSDGELLQRLFLPAPEGAFFYKHEVMVQIGRKKMTRIYTVTDDATLSTFEIKTP